MNAHINENNGVAVLIIDMQDFFLDRFDLDKRNTLITNQIRVIDFCLEKMIPIIAVTYEGKGDITHSLASKLTEVPHVGIITKEFNSAFRNTNLEDILTEKKIKKLILMGINASGCVQDTAIGALKRGFEIATGKTVVASSSKSDANLAVSKKWYSEKGTFFETTEELLNYLEL